jgi:E3 ubiquitin-protein ligase TRIP12
MSRFLAAILASRDQSTLVVNALQLVELLLSKLPATYQYVFRKEGVMHEVERLANEPLLSLPRTKKSVSSRAMEAVQRKEQQAAEDRDAGGAPDPGTSMYGTTTNSPSGITHALRQHNSGITVQSPSVADGARPPTPAKSELSPAEALARDSITLRARHVRDSLSSASVESVQRADSDLEAITRLAEALVGVSDDADDGANEEKAAQLLRQVAELFSREKNATSSFEMLESGLVDALLRFATSGKDSPRSSGLIN